MRRWLGVLALEATASMPHHVRALGDRGLAGAVPLGRAWANHNQRSTTYARRWHSREPGHMRYAQCIRHGGTPLSAEAAQRTPPGVN